MEDFTKKLLDNQRKSFDLMTEMRNRLRKARTVEDIRKIQTEFKRKNQALWDEFDKIRPN